MIYYYGKEEEGWVAWWKYWSSGRQNLGVRWPHFQRITWVGFKAGYLSHAYAKSTNHLFFTPLNSLCFSLPTCYSFQCELATKNHHSKFLFEKGVRASLKKRQLKAKNKKSLAHSEMFDPFKESQVQKLHLLMELGPITQVNQMSGTSESSKHSIQHIHVWSEVKTIVHFF